MITDRNDTHFANTTTLHQVFNLDDSKAYLQWREKKLALYSSTPDITVTIKNPYAVSDAERQSLCSLIHNFNMAIYQTDTANIEDDNIPKSIGETFGLSHLDRHLCSEESGIAALRFNPDKLHGEYIPYSRRAINWHTDGYYNQPQHRINSVLLHCVTSAQNGGENAVMDPDILYILLRDEDPEYIRSLSRPNVMTIPENIQDGKVIRDAQTGPVFYNDDNGLLHMRYTARTRSIEWEDTPEVTRATKRITEILSEANSPYILHFRMKPGEGIICNNVLHMRTGFEDGETSGESRLVYRARYYDAIKCQD